jgi:HflK protein
VIGTELVRRTELGFRSAAPVELGERELARRRLTVGGPSNPVPAAMQAQTQWFQREGIPEESFLLTGDGNLLEVRVTVQYRVKDPVAYAFAIAEPENLVRSLTLAALGAVVGTSTIDAVYTSARAEVEARVARTVQGHLDGYGSGIELISVHLLYVHAPAEVHDAFRDVASAHEDKMRTINRAGMFAAEEVNQAEGEAGAMVEQALAFKDEQILRARGDAAAFGLKVDAYEAAPELTRFRLQLETIEQVLPGVAKFVRPGAQDLKELDLWLLEPFATGGERP